MKRALGLLLVLAAGCASGPSAAIDAAIDRQIRAGFTGSVLVARDDEILVHRAHGVPRGTKTRFWIASVGKQFAAAAILVCRDRGKLTLDDPLSRFFEDLPEDKRAITVRQLLTHTSGLPQTYASEDAADRQAAVSAIARVPLARPPGEAFGYSNDNYQLAAAIVEVVSGAPYPTFVERELLAPLGLDDTGQTDEARAALVAPAKEATPERLRRRSWGGQGWYSTTEDLFRWYRALVPARAEERGRVVADAAALFTPVAEIREGHAAAGWFVGTTDGGVRRVFVRGNEDFGPNALLYAYPDERVVIVVLTHAGDTADGQSHSRALHAAIEQILFPVE
ncbi:MAG: beta-lactamase family protein [Myxococcales bacterium]|nr:beta-lactamase family protein [Myxococcales bacterium]MCB9646716.1 beta-lactamase family protein [Deltaproteobacteria bacterium]